MWKCAQYTFDERTPIVVGIVNVTPDSFSDGGKYFDVEKAVEHGRKLYDAGASIIDVGGESTRPWSEEVPPEEEMARVLQVVHELASDNICVSIDTRHSKKDA